MATPALQEDISPGLKPGSEVDRNVRAEARTYLRNKGKDVQEQRQRLSGTKAEADSLRE
jgi:hypothetical protein